MNKGKLRQDGVELFAQLRTFLFLLERHICNLVLIHFYLLVDHYISLEILLFLIYIKVPQHLLT